MTGRVFTKLLFSFVLVLCVSTAILDFSLRRIVDLSLHDQATRSLEAQARLLASELESAKSGAHPAELSALVTQGSIDAGAKVTVYSLPEGAMVANSEPRAMAAGADRKVPPEIAQAAAQPRRPVHVERDGVLYVADAFGDRVVDLSYPLDDIYATMHVLRRDLLLASLLALFVATLTAALLAHRVAKRLKRIVTFATRIAA